MKRRIAVAAVVVLALVPQSFAGTWHKTVSDAQKVAKQKDQLILVDMFAQWCGWCHRFEQEVFPSMVFQDATADMVLLRLDTEDGKEGTRFARQYGISSLPTFIILAPDLSVAGMIRGYAPPNEFVGSLKDTRAKYKAFLKRMKNEANLGDDWVQRLQLAKELTERGSYDKSEPRLKRLTAEKSVPNSIRDEAYYYLAMTYTLEKKYTAGLKTIHELTARSDKGESVERAYLLAGNIYLEQGNYLSAANEFRDFKKKFPSSPLVRNVDMVLPGIERRLVSGQ